MTARNLFIPVLTLLLAGWASPAAFAQGEDGARLVRLGNRVGDVRIIVAFQPGTSAAAKDRVLLRAGAIRIKRLDKFNVVVAAVHSLRSRRALEGAPSVKLVETDFVSKAIVQNIPTGVRRIGADPPDLSSRNRSRGSAAVGVVVAIVDSGIDLDHPDLERNIIGSHNSVNSKKSADDDNGHGSHVAGTVAARNNTIGVVGISSEAFLLAVKVLNAQGSGWNSDIAEGIVWATDNGAEVINMSLGGSSSSIVIEAAVQEAAAAGVVIVCAAGNAGNAAPGSSTVGYPAAYPECIAVSAWTDLDGTPTATGQISPYGDPDESLASFSSTGPEVEIAAPGVEIESCWENGGYNTISGTSMACPHVTGVVALRIADGSTDPRSDLQASTETISGTPDEVGGGLLSAGEPNDNPIVTITSPSDLDTFASGATISFAGSALDTEDGPLTGSLVWSSDTDGQIGTGGSFTAVLSDGSHDITAAVTDSGGRTGSATIHITVGTPPPPPPGVTVTSVNYATQGGPGDKDLLITVALEDDNQSPVAGADVSIDLFLNGSLFATGGPSSTGADGTITWILTNHPSGTYTTTVTDVAAAGLTWDTVTPPNTYTKP